MPVPLLSRFRLSAWTFAALLGVILTIFAIRNLPWHLDDYDQAKQAYVSYEMVKQEHWWLQHTPAGRIATKPPLVGWISAGLWLATAGFSWDLAWRLPGILAAAVLLWILAREGWRLSSWEGASLAIAAFGLNTVAPRLTTLVRTDMVLALFISLAGFLIYRKLQAGTPWTTMERWGIFLALLGSMLTKGPIAYAFLLPGVVAFWWLHRSRFLAVGAWSGWWSWLGPLGFFALWAIIGARLSPEFYDQVVRREFLGRFTVGEAAVHNNQPFFFYALHILRDFFPWSLVLIALACVPDVRAKLRRDPALLWLVCWALGGLLIMSLVPSKRGDRIFPIYPALCLLVPAMVALLPPHLARWRGLTAPIRVLVLVSIGTLSAGGYAVYRWRESVRHHDQALTHFSRQVKALQPSPRLAIVAGKDEGMLLYLDVLRFTKWDDAVELWQQNALDLLVLPRKLEKEAQRTLPDAEPRIYSHPAKDKSSEYVCLVRRQR